MFQVDRLQESTDRCAVIGCIAGQYDIRNRGFVECSGNRPEYACKLRERGFKPESQLGKGLVKIFKFRRMGKNSQFERDMPDVPGSPHARIIKNSMLAFHRYFRISILYADFDTTVDRIALLRFI